MMFKLLMATSRIICQRHFMLFSFFISSMLAIHIFHPIAASCADTSQDLFTPNESIRLNTTRDILMKICTDVEKNKMVINGENHRCDELGSIDIYRNKMTTLKMDIKQTNSAISDMANIIGKIYKSMQVISDKINIDLKNVSEMNQVLK